MNISRLKRDCFSLLVASFLLLAASDASDADDESYNKFCYLPIIAKAHITIHNKLLEALGDGDRLSAEYFTDDQRKALQEYYKEYVSIRQFALICLKKFPKRFDV